jgi:hypothetical protein
LEQRTKDVIIIIIIPCIITAVGGFVFMLWGAWYTGVKWHSPFSTYWLKVVLGAPVPLWFALIIVIAAFIALWKAYTAYRHWKKESTILEKELAELKSKVPKLHGVWNNAQTFWHMGRQGEAPMMQIGGWIDLTSSNTEDILYLLAAFIGDSRAQIFMDVEVKPKAVNRAMVMLFIVPPVSTDTTKPFTAAIVVEDQFNRRYQLPPHEFRATPGQTLPPLRNLEKLEPVLHASWFGDSAWGWASSHPEEDPIYMIRGDVTLLMDNIKEQVIITGVDIEGAELLGKFDNSKLDPSQPETRGMRLHFRSKAPAGNDYYTVQSVFTDLRAKRYPTVPHRFHPLPIPERVDIQRGHR